MEMQLVVIPILIAIPKTDADRLERLAPRQGGSHAMQEYHSRIVLNGLEHPDFIHEEYDRRISILECEKSMLLGQLTVTQKKLSTSTP